MILKFQPRNCYRYLACYMCQANFINQAYFFSLNERHLVLTKTGNMKLLKINILSYNDGFIKVVVNFTQVLSIRHFECKFGANF